MSKQKEQLFLIAMVVGASYQGQAYVRGQEYEVPAVVVKALGNTCVLKTEDGPEVIEQALTQDKEDLKIAAAKAKADWEEAKEATKSAQEELDEASAAKDVALRLRANKLDEQAKARKVYEAAQLLVDNSPQTKGEIAEEATAESLRLSEIADAAEEALKEAEKALAEAKKAVGAENAAPSTQIALTAAERAYARAEAVYNDADKVAEQAEEVAEAARADAGAEGAPAKKAPAKKAPSKKAPAKKATEK